MNAIIFNTLSVLSIIAIAKEGSPSRSIPGRSGCSGYLENGAANRRSFVRGWYYIDDKAAMDDDGNFWFIGRDDDVIKASEY